MDEYKERWIMNFYKHFFIEIQKFNRNKGCFKSRLKWIFLATMRDTAREAKKIRTVEMKIKELATSTIFKEMIKGE